MFSSGVSHAEAEAEDWFARRLDGSLIKWACYPGHWQLRPWDPEYRDRWRTNVVTEIATGPFDGVFADNDVFDDYYGLGLPIEGVPDAAELRAGLGALVREAGTALRAVGKILVPNIAEARREPGRWAAHAAYGGGFDETWLGWAPDEMFDATTALAQMPQLHGPGLTIVRTPTDGDDAHPNFRLGLAAFWVFGAGRGAYAATGRDDHSKTQHIPELDWDLGPAVGAPVGDGELWTRTFSDGWAAVNLSHDTAHRVTPPSAAAGFVWVDAEGRSLPSAVALRPQRGVLLRLQDLRDQRPGGR